ncbi:hypothetical protein GCM10027568_20000 [Humibacter soli]
MKPNGSAWSISPLSALKLSLALSVRTPGVEVVERGRATRVVVLLLPSPSASGGRIVVQSPCTGAIG